MKMKSVHMIGMLAAFAVAAQASSGDAYLLKKPTVKTVEKAVDFDVNAGMRDDAWAVYVASPDRARLASEEFAAHLDDAKKAGASDFDIEDLAHSVLGNNYRFINDGLVPEAVSEQTGDEQPSHEYAEPEPGGDFVYSVRTKNCKRRCRAGMCFTPTPVLLEQVSEDVLAALRADPFLVVE